MYLSYYTTSFSLNDVDVNIYTTDLVPFFTGTLLVQIGGTLYVSTDIRQLLINLLNNSIHYSKKGIISVNIDIVTNSNDKNLLIAVQDQGTGIKDAELEMIFQPFKQGSKGKVKVTGSGIGLAVSKEIVEAHKGKITAKNNSESTGATVEFTIPIN